MENQEEEEGLSIWLLLFRVAVDVWIIIFEHEQGCVRGSGQNGRKGQGCAAWDFRQMIPPRYARAHRIDSIRSWQWNSRTTREDLGSVQRWNCSVLRLGDISGSSAASPYQDRLPIISCNALSIRKVAKGWASIAQPRNR